MISVLTPVAGNCYPRVFLRKYRGDVRRSWVIGPEALPVTHEVTCSSTLSFTDTSSRAYFAGRTGASTLTLTDASSFTHVIAATCSATMPFTDLTSLIFDAVGTSAATLTLASSTTAPAIFFRTAGATFTLTDTSAGEVTGAIHRISVGSTVTWATLSSVEEVPIIILEAVRRSPENVSTLGAVSLVRRAPASDDRRRPPVGLTRASDPPGVL